MTDLATLVVKLEAETSQYQAQLSSATKQLQGFQTSVAEFAEDLVKKFAAAFTVDAVAEFIANAIESAAALERLSKESGVAVEELSALAAVFAQSGVGQDEMASSLKKLNQAISDAAGNASSKAAFAFQALGISVTNSSGSLKTAGQLLPEIADAYAKLADGPNKVRINTDLLGKSALALIPTLDQGAQGLDDLQAAAIASGAALSGELAEAAETLEKKFIALKQSVTGSLSTQALEELLPTLTALVDGMKDIGASAAPTNAALAVLNGVLKSLGAFALDLQGDFKQLGNALSGIEDAAIAAGTGIKNALGEVFNFDDDGSVTALIAAGKKILGIYQDTAAQAQSINRANNDAINNLYAAGGKKQIDLTAEIAATIKSTLAHAFDGLNEASSQGVSPILLQQLDVGQKKVTDFAAALKVQAESFDKGTAAQTAYKLSTGSMGDAVAAARKAIVDLGNSTAPGADAVRKFAQETITAADNAQKWSAQLQAKIDTKAVTEYTDKLQDQVIKLGQGDVAAIDFATTVGKLGLALKNASDNGDAARAHIHDLAVELANDKDKTALFAVDQQILTLGEHLGAAEAAAFKFQNALLVKNIAATGGATTDAQLDALRKLSVTQDEYNQLQEHQASIVAAAAVQEAAINKSVADNQTSQIDGQKQINDLRATESQQLSAIFPKIAAYQIQQVDNLGKLKQAQADYNALQLQFARIQADEAQREQAINDAVRNGQESELSGQADIAAARVNELAQLGDVYTSMKAISDANAKDLPALVDRTNAANASLKTLAASTNELANKLRTDFVNDAGDAFASFVTGTQTAAQAAHQFLTSFETEIIKLATSKALESLLGSVGQGGGGGLFGALAGLLGGGGNGLSSAANASIAATGSAGVDDSLAVLAGGLASGGPAMAGMSYTVGEHGAEEFIPDTNGTIVPNGKMSKGITVHNHFTIAAPTGTVSRQTQAQIAASVGDGISRAQRRDR